MSSTGHHICLNVFFPRTPARFALRCRGLRANQCPSGHQPTAGHPEPRHISPHTSMVPLRNAPCGHPQTCGSVRVTQCILKPDGDVKYPLKRRTGSSIFRQTEPESCYAESSVRGRKRRVWKKGEKGTEKGGFTELLTMFKTMLKTVNNISMTF